MKFKTISGRLIFWFLTVNFLALCTVISIIYIQRVRYLKSDNFNKLTAIRDLKVEQVNNWLEERKGDIKTISEDDDIRDIEILFNKKDRTIREENLIVSLRDFLGNYVENYTAFETVSIANAGTGIIELSTDRDIEGQDISKENYFLETLKKKELYITDIHLSKTKKIPVMIFSMPAYSMKEKKIVAIVTGRVNLDASLYHFLLNRTGLGETGETLIVNKDFIAVSKLRWYEDGPCRLKISGTPGILAASGKTGINESRDYRGVPVLSAYTFIPLMSWGFVAKQDLSEFYRPIDEMFRNFLVILIIASIIIFFIAIFIAKTFREPLVEMTEVSKKIQSGDFSARNKFKREDELGFLAESFNNMADDLMSRMYVRKKLSDLTEIMLKTYDLKEFSSSLLEKILEITSCQTGAFYLKRGDVFEHFFSIGLNRDNIPSFNMAKLEGQFGKVLLTGKISHIKNIPSDTVFTLKTIAGTAMMREIISIPLMSDGNIMAILSMGNMSDFSKDSLEIINQIWPVINTGFSVLMANEDIKNMSEELKDKNSELQSQSEELMAQSKELHHQNLELEMQNRQIEEANRMKSEFVSNMSHELRTPLNSVIGLSKVLLMQAKERLSEEELSYLEVIQRNGKSLLSLINDILDLSKIEAGRMELSITSFSLRDIVENICENLEILAFEKGIMLKRDLPDTLPVIKSDEAGIYKILQNITGNAIKFTDKGSVIISGEEKNEKIYIHVTDTGIGIAQNDVPHIFDEFRQVDGTTSRRHEGTGLGLSIAYKTAKLLKGSIYVESVPGKGSTFTVILPIEWEDEIKSEYDITSDISKITSRSSGKKVLVVDDDPSAVTRISSYLSEEGYSVIPAFSGKEALEFAEKFHPFAITLDLLMPDMDGFEVLENLKKSEKTRNIPVIIISVSDQHQTACALGAAGYITKPVTRDILMNEIYRLVKVPASVMIVDDNPVDRKLISDIIEKEYIKTCQAENGEECLELMEHTCPDIVILDLMMPGMDGFRVLDTIRNMEGTKSLPVIVVTAKDLTKEEKHMLNNYTPSIIMKHDVKSETLLKEIKKCLSDISYNQKPGKDLLLVEDNKGAVIEVRTVLEKEGFRVSVAGGGREAIDYIKHTVPDGIILDLMMPDVDGFEVLNEIRSKSHTSSIPVLILTAKDLTSEDLRKLKSNNIQQLIKKGDINKKELLEKVKLLMGKGRHEMKKIISEEKPPEKIFSDKPLILIVEDNPDNIITIKAMLGNKYNLIESSSGEEGLSKAISEKPDLILLDMALPGMDGFNVVKNLKKDLNIKDIPVIALTSMAMKGDREAILDSGCNDYISKPVEQEELLGKIEKWIGKSEE